MADRKNNNVVEDIHSLSQLGGDAVLRDSHSYPGHYIRTRESLTVVTEYFDTFEIEYNADDLPTQVCYYAGTRPHLTTIAFSSDNAGSLNNTYFFLYASQSNTRFHVWYNVDGLGTDPNPGNSIGIEVPLSSNDPAAIVANATQLVLQMSVYKTYFTLTRSGNVVKIQNDKNGIIDDTMDVDTSFVFTNEQGDRELVQKVNLSYNGRNPIYNGQELIDYVYNIYTGRFDKNPEIAVDVELEITAESFLVTNGTTGVAGAELAIPIPDGTKRFLLKAANLTTLSVSYTSGGDSFTIPSGANWTEEGLKTVGVTIYVSASKDNQDLELITWS